MWSRKRRRNVDESGQAALEYLLVGLVMIAMICALGAIWRFVSEGGMSQLLAASASHAIAQVGGVLDVLSF